MSKLIFETGNCKLKGFDYPVRIHATDGGASGTDIIGDYRDPHRGWVNYSWRKTGIHSSFNEDINLVPIPQFYYFSLYESNRGNPTAGSFKTSINELPEKGSGSTRLLGTYKYTDGLIEKVEESGDRDMREVPNSMNKVEDPYPPLVIGITASQYRADLDKLWTALNGNKNGVDDVFTMCANRIKKLEDALRPFAVFACSEKNSCICNNCVARDLLDT